MSGKFSGHIIKLRRTQRVKSKQALRIMAKLAIMQDREEVSKEFLETGRTGRRNAMPDILHPQGGETTTADLPSRLQDLAMTDTPENPQPGTSKEPDLKNNNNPTSSRENS